MTLTPGFRLGSYEVLSALGAGGMGEVYRARDTKLGREVAVKVIPSSFSADPGRLRRFEHEARAAGALNHPNILAIYDLGIHDGSPYLVSELLEGTTLREQLVSGALPVRRTVGYSIQIAEGLAAAHEKGIVHRDLKPENLFVAKDGRIKILDFGLAKLTHPEVASRSTTEASTVTADTEPGAVVGTVGYMSPEQVRGLPVDSRSDIFSFGSILYEMLSGQRPFQGDSPADTMSAILREDPLELSLGDPRGAALWPIVRHCLEKSKEQRFQCARDLAFVLHALSGASRESSMAASTARRESQRPIYRRLTFRPGAVVSARFSPDGQTVVCTARWQSDSLETFSLRLDSPESRSLGLTNAHVRAISSSGEMVIVKDIQRSLGIQGGRGVLARMPLAGGAPREILEDVFYADWSPDGKQLAVARMVGQRSQLDFPIGTVLYRPTGWLGFPRVSPGGDHVAFLNYPRNDVSGSVMIVDRSGTAKTLSEGWDNIQGLAWSPDGREVWFTASKVGFATALHAVTLGQEERLVEQVPGGLVLHDISRTGKVLLAHRSERAGILCRLAGDTQERDLSWFEYSVSSDLSADGKMLLFGESGESVGPLHAVYLRGTDGSPPIRLGEGEPLALSPDGKWALAMPNEGDRLVLLPTRTGEPRVLVHGGLTHHARAAWFPDGRRIVFAANEEGHAARSYLRELDRADWRPITPEGTLAYTVSPDGRYVAGMRPEPMLYPTEGGSALPIPGAVPGDAPIRWDADGRSLFVREGFRPARVFRLDLATGLRDLVWTLAPSDPAVNWVDCVSLTADGGSYAFTYWSIQSDLYLVEGLS